MYTRHITRKYCSVKASAARITFGSRGEVKIKIKRSATWKRRVTGDNEIVIMMIMVIMMIIMTNHQ